ncbi:cache domain-containing protein [Vibrio sp. PP-XX7]
MLFLAILTTLGVGSYVIWSFTNHFEIEMLQAEAQAIEVQKALLDNQLSAVVSRLDYERSRTESRLRDKLREHTNTAISIAQTLYDKNQGHLPEAAIKSLIIETLRPLRFFNGRGYYIIGTIEAQDTKVLLAPPTPELEGQSLWNFRGAMGNYPGRDIMNSVNNDAGEGYTRHLWYPPGQTQRRAKITHARRFEPYNWVIGNGEYPYRIVEDLKKQHWRKLRTFVLGTTAI